jgi:hypothetical protein
MGFTHFAPICVFDEPTELHPHDEHPSLDDGLRGAIARLGPVFPINAYPGSASRAQGRRNIFPHLSFHFDHGRNQPRHHS